VISVEFTKENGGFHGIFHGILWKNAPFIDDHDDL
jgi:hypothetical protein